MDDGAQHAGYHFDHKLIGHTPGHDWNDIVDLKEIVPAREFGFHYVRLAATIARAEKLDNIDLMLVDGRWRHACAMQAWLLSSNNTHVILHDSSRKEYTGIFNHFSLVEEVDTMSILKPLKLDDSAQRELVWKELLSALSAPG